MGAIKEIFGLWALNRRYKQALIPPITLPIYQAPSGTASIRFTSSRLPPLPPPHMVAQKLLILTFVRISFVRNRNAQSRLRGLNRGPSIARRRARDRLPPGEARRGRPFTSFASTSSDPRRCPRHFTDFPPPPISTMLRTAQDKQTPRDGRYFGVTPSVSVHSAPCKRNDGHWAS